MKSLLVITLIGITLLSLQSCYYDKADQLYESNCDTVNVTYSGTIVPVVGAFCLSCHGAAIYKTLGGSINLEGYSNIIVQVQDGVLLKAIKHEAGASPMPKNQQQLSDCNIAKFEIWINQGAPDN